MRVIFTYVNRYKKAFVIALVLMVTELIVELVQPVVMATIIDEGIVKRDMETVMFWGGVLVLLSLLAFIAGIVSSFYASEVSQGVGHDVRRDLFKQIQSFSALQMQKFSTSSLITRMTADVTQVQGFLFTSMRIMLRAPLFIIGGIVMALTIHVQLAIVLVLVVPFLLFIMYWITRKGISLFQSVQVKLDNVNRVIRENLLGIRLVKAYHRMDHENQRFSKVNSSLTEDNKKALKLMESTMPIVMLGMNVAIIIIIWFGYSELEQGTAQPGELVAILNYAVRITGSFGVFSFLIMTFSRGKASSTRISEVLTREAEESIESRVSEPTEVNGHIRFEQVFFSYPNTKKEALTDISFEIKAGQTIGVLGETGSGKSTLLQLIPRLYPVASGDIYIDEKRLGERESWLRNHISMVPQEAHLFSGTIRGNIAWDKEDASTEEIIQAAKDANIHAFIESLPNGYQTKIGQRGVNLSGGQKQRISIARALVKDPSILLLDDSTSALDAKTEFNVLQAIKKRACTTFVVAQKVSSIIDADQIMLLQQGNLVAFGNHASLLENSALYQKIYRSQTNEGVVHNDSATKE